MNLRFVFVIGLFCFSLAGSLPVHAQESVKEAEQLDFAQGLLSRGMYDMAILQYQKFISDYPHSNDLQEAYLALGESYFLSQDFDRALNAFNQFKQLYPHSDQLPISLLRSGQIDIEKKGYDDALKELTSIDVQKQLKGDMLQSFDFYIAQAYKGKGDEADALDYFQKAAAVDGATTYTADAFKEIGKIDLQKGQYSDAMNEYGKSLQSAKDDALKAELTYRMAEAQFLSGNYTDAIKSFQQVLDQYSNSDYAHDALGNMLLAYFNAGQYDQLLSQYQKNVKIIKNDESCFEIHLVAVMAYIELKQFDQANALLDRMLAFSGLKSKERAKIFIKKADILIRQKKFKDALALIDAYSSQNSDNADENFFLKAECYFGLGNFDQAFNFFENVYLNFPDSRFSKAALLGQAHSRKETGRYKEAEVLFMKYYDTQDDPALKSDSMFDAIMMAVKAGDVSGVIKSAQEYLKEFPAGEEYVDVLLILADRYGQNDQSQQAIDLLQGYIAKNPAIQRPNSVYFLLGYNEQLLGKSDLALAAYAQVDKNKEEGKFYLVALKNMAIIYLTEKKEEQAKVYFDQLINQADHNDLQLSTYVWICNEYLKEQKFNDVLQVATQAEKYFSPSDLSEIRYFEAEALRGLGRCDEAYKSYDLVTASPQKDAFTGSAHIGYGLCLENAKKYDEAGKEFQKALDENADDNTVTVHARFEMANMEVAQGDISDAQKLYLLIATIYDDDYYCSESLLGAGKIFEQLKDNANALKMYSEILDKYRNSAAAVYAKARVSLLK